MTGPATFRVFVALWPGAEAVAHLGDALTGLETGATVAPRWIPPERWHVTLAFVGNVDEEGLDRVVRRTRSAASATSSLRLRLAGAGRFGPAVLWAGMAGDLEPLAALARRIGWQERPLRPHLTLARGRGSIDMRPWVTWLSAYAGPWWVAEEVTVVRSLLGPAPRYDVLERVPLTRPAAGPAPAAARDGGPRPPRGRSPSAATD